MSKAVLAKKGENAERFFMGKQFYILPETERSGKKVEEFLSNTIYLLCNEREHVNVIEPKQKIN
jgi:hypothetical protein